MIREARRRKWLGISGASGVSRKPGFGDDLRTRSARIARAPAAEPRPRPRRLQRFQPATADGVENELYAA